MLLTSIVTTLATSLPGPAGSGGEWLTDYDEAMAKAAETDRIVLMDFTGSDWCGWCIKLHGEVFDEPEFKKWAAENAVLLELDFPRDKPQPKKLAQQNAKLARKFGVRGYPTILFLDARGMELARSGYVRGGPKAWIAEAEKKLKKARKAQQGHGAWLTRYPAALKAAKESKKAVLVDFTGSDWCRWCKQLDAEVFGTAEFQKWAEKNVVLLELDFPRRKPQVEELKAQNAALAKKYGVRGYPTILFLDADGAVLGRSGYKPGGPKAWIADAEIKLKGNR